MGETIPACRSARPSSTGATPSRSAPAERNARAAMTALCPYPSALTTPRTRAPFALRFASRRLWDRAEASIRASGGRTRTSKARRAGSAGSCAATCPAAGFALIGPPGLAAGSTAPRAERSRLAVDQGLHIRLERDVDLVAAHDLDEAEPERGVLEEIVGREELAGRVPACPRRILRRDQGLPAGDDRLRPLGGLGLPGALLGRVRLGAAVVVLASTSIAADAGRLVADHRQDGMAEHHLAFGALRVDVAAHFESMCH